MHALGRPLDAGRRGRLRARHDRRHERAARAPRRAHRAGHDRGLPRRHRDRPPGPPGALRPRRSAGPPPLVPRELRFAVRERMGPDGVLAPLDDGQRASARSTRLREAEVEAVAVCLLFAFLHPEHERRVGEAMREALPGRARLAARARCCRSSASTSASRRRWPTPTSGRSCAPTSSGWRRARRGGRACPRRWSCSPRAAWSTLEAAAADAAGVRALRARPAAWSAPRTSRAPAATRTC